MQPCLKSDHFSFNFSLMEAKTHPFMFKLVWQSLFVACPTFIFSVLVLHPQFYSRN